MSVGRFPRNLHNQRAPKRPIIYVKEIFAFKLLNLSLFKYVVLVADTAIGIADRITLTYNIIVIIY